MAMPNYDPTDDQIDPNLIGEPLFAEMQVWEEEILEVFDEESALRLLGLPRTTIPFGDES